MKYISKVVFLIITVFSTNISTSQCVKPVTNTNNVSQWDDLMNYSVSGQINKNIKFVQTIDGYGEGDINIDFYSITIDRPKDMTKFLDDMRKDLNHIIFGGPRLGTLFGSFNTYSEEDKEKWNSSDPTGALMSFTMASAGFASRRGSVVLSCYSPNQWIFSTVTTNNDGFHPVSGNRAFGFIENDDKTITIYTKGADRVAVVDPLAELIGGVDAVDWFILYGGDNIWKTFLTGLELKYKDYRSHWDKMVVFRKMIKYKKPNQPVPTGATLNPKDNIPLIFESQKDAYLNGVTSYQGLNLICGEELESAQLKNEIAKAVKVENDSLIAYYSGLYFSHSLKNGIKSTIDILNNNDLFNPNKLKFEFDGDLAKSIFINELRVNFSNGMNQSVLDDFIDPETHIYEYKSNSVIEIIKDLNENQLSLDDIIEVLSEKVEDSVKESLETEIKKIEDELLAKGYDYFKSQLDMDDETVEQILNLNDLINNKISWEDFETQMIQNIDQLIFKAAMASGNCLCRPPKCSYFEAICTGYYWKNRIYDWDLSLDSVISLLADLYPELDSFKEGFEYYNKLNEYVDKIEFALDLYRKAESLNRIVRAFKNIDENIERIRNLNLRESIDADIAWRLERSKKILRDTSLRKLDLIKWKIYKDDTRFPLVNFMIDFENNSAGLVQNLHILELEFEDFPTIRAYLGEISASISSLLSYIHTDVKPLFDTYNRELNRIDELLLDDISGASDLYKIAKDENRINTLKNVNYLAFEMANGDVMTLLDSIRTSDKILVDLPFKLNNFGASRFEIEDREAYNKSYFSILEELEKLYHFQDEELIRRRLNETTYPFFYFRQFPPYFYRMSLDQMKLDPSLQDYLKLTMTYRGLMMGDLHPQNFGTIMPLVKGDKLKLVVNDPDDGGEGSLFLDFFRFLVGTELLEEGLTTDNIDLIFESYLIGLNNEDRTYSQATKNLITNMDYYKNRLVNEHSKLDGSEFRKDKYLIPHYLTTPLSSEELNYAQSEVKKFFHKEAFVEDHYKYRRLKGGSGGNLRWEVLVSLSQDNIRGHSLKKNYYWIEFKMLGVIPGNYPASTIDYTSIPKDQLADNAINRYKTNLTIGQSTDAMPLYRFVKTTDGPAMMRFRSEGNQFYPIEFYKAFDKDLLKEMIFDQSYLLGKVHKKGYDLWNKEGDTNAIQNYIGSLKNLNDKTLKKYINKIKSNLETDFIRIKNYDDALLTEYLSLSKIPTEKVTQLKKLVVKEYFDALDEDERDELNAFESDYLDILLDFKDAAKILIVVEHKRLRANEIQTKLKVKSPESLCVYEINAQPANILYDEKEKGWSKSDFEYVLLANISNATINSTGLKFVDGINHKFKDNIEILKGEFILIAGDIEAVKMRYDFSEIKIAYEGEFEDISSLNKMSELLVLKRTLIDDYGREVVTTYIEQYYDYAKFSKSENSMLLNLTFQNNLRHELNKDQWIISKRGTHYAMFTDLVPVAINYNGGKNKYDFIILRNISDKTLDTRGLAFSKGINYEFKTILKPSEEIMLKADTSIKLPNYAHPVFQYKGKLSNAADELKLASILNQEERKIYGLKYDKNWFVKANGNGNYIKPKNVCDNLSLMMEPTGWQEAPISSSMNNISVNCEYPVRINLCGDKAVNEVWIEQTTEGSKTYKCVKDGDKIYPISTN